MANEKKGLKEFLELIIKDEEVAKEVEKADEDASKIVKIAKKHGCEFTEDEYNDLKMEAVSGGIMNDFKLGVKTAIILMENIAKHGFTRGVKQTRRDIKPMVDNYLNNMDE